MRGALDRANRRLEGSKAKFAEATAALRESTAWLEALTASGMEASERRQTTDRLQRELEQAEAAHKRHIAAVVKAQADYDSTREGLHELRAALDLDARPELRERYLRAQSEYEREAALRTVRHGPQAPLSAAGAETSTVGRALLDAGTRAWLKSATEPDEHSGLYEHKVNLVRYESGTRRSATVHYLSPRPVDPGSRVGVAMRGEPTLGDVADAVLECVRARTYPSYDEWCTSEQIPDTPRARHRWRESFDTVGALRTFLLCRDLAGLLPPGEEAKPRAHQNEGPS